jgi:hypothetical protein
MWAVTRIKSPAGGAVRASGAVRAASAAALLTAEDDLLAAASEGLSETELAKYLNSTDVTVGNGFDQIKRVATKLFEPPAIENGKILTMACCQQIKLICSRKEPRGDIDITGTDLKQELQQI